MPRKDPFEMTAREWRGFSYEWWRWKDRKDEACK